jgi:hypothetical protein
MSAMTVASEIRSQRGTITLGDRLAGLGGLIFVAILVVQNGLRASAPGFDAGPGKVTAYFVHHRPAALIPLGLYPIGMLALFFFVAGIWNRANRDESRWWATVGGLGGATIVALFGLVNIVEIVLTAKAGSLAGSPGVVEALWALHGAAFGLDLAAVGVTLIGLSRASVSTGLIPSWISAAALPAAACLLTAGVFAVSITDGGAWVALGLVGFVMWIVFVVVASSSLLRQTRVS